MIYFIADTHFGHENVIRFCSRPFSCAAEMDEALIKNWNRRVCGHDTVYIVGDMFLHSVKDIETPPRFFIGEGCS